MDNFAYNYDYSGGDGAFIATMAGFIFIILAIALVFYILFVMGLYRMAKNQNIENAWLAFIPLANFYIMGCVIGPIKIGDYYFDRQKAGLLVLVVPLGLMVLANIPFIGIIFSLASFAFWCAAYYYLYSRYSTDNKPVILLVVSVVTLFMASAIIIFAIRNNEYNNPDMDIASGGGTGYKYCPSCGQANDISTHFCSNCGNNFTA